MNIFETMMKYCENKFHQTGLFMSWQKIKRLVPKSQLSVIFMNRQTMFQTQKKSPLSIKIWWYLMTSCFRNKISVKPITFVEGIPIVIVCIWVKISSNCLVKQFEKMPISFVCFLKTRKILITFLTTMCLKTWQKNSSKICVRLRGRSHTILLWLIWPQQRTVGNTDRGLTTSILFDKWTLNFLNKLWEILLRKL